MNNDFNHISASNELKAETLKKAKSIKPIRWRAMSAIAAALVVTIGVSAFAISKGDYKNLADSYGGFKGSAPESNMAPSYSVENSTDTLYNDETKAEDIILEANPDEPGSSTIIKDSSDVHEAPSLPEATSAPETAPMATKKPDVSLSVDLTAAKLDDNKEFDAWLKSKEEFSTFKTYDTFGFSAINRYVVTVVDNEDKPVKNAKVTLLSGGAELFTTFTTNKGIAYLYYNWHKSSSDEKPDKIRVQSKDTVITENIADKKDITIKGDFEKTPLTNLDIMFMIDTTGSMSDELSYLKYQTNAMLQSLPTQLNTQISVNFYRDEGDDYVVKSNPFTSSLTEVSSYFNQTDATGGGDTPEAIDMALKNAVVDHEWRDDSVKIMFLVLDAPAHDDRQTISHLYSYISIAAERGIRIVPVMASGADEVCEVMCRQFALITGGQFVFLTNDSGIGGSHRDPVTETKYEVKPLIAILKEIINEYTY